MADAEGSTVFVSRNDTIRSLQTVAGNLCQLLCQPSIASRSMEAFLNERVIDTVVELCCMHTD